VRYAIFRSPFWKRIETPFALQTHSGRRFDQSRPICQTRGLAASSWLRRSLAVSQRRERRQGAGHGLRAWRADSRCPDLSSALRRGEARGVRAAGASFLREERALPSKMDDCDCIGGQWATDDLLMRYQHVSDFFIALALLSIPLELIYFVKKSAVFPYRYARVHLQVPVGRGRCRCRLAGLGWKEQAGSKRLEGTDWLGQVAGAVWQGQRSFSMASEGSLCLEMGLPFFTRHEGTQGVFLFLTIAFSSRAPSLSEYPLFIV